MSSELRDTLREGEYAFWSLFWRVGVPLAIVVTVLGVCGGMVLWPTRIVQRVADPDHAIASYEYFEQQLQDVKAADGQIQTAEQAIADFVQDAGPRDSWKFDDRQEHARLCEVRDGLRYYRAQLVAQYNARSRMLNRALWKRPDLPRTLE